MTTTFTLADVADKKQQQLQQMHAWTSHDRLSAAAQNGVSGQLCSAQPDQKVYHQCSLAHSRPAQHTIKLQTPVMHVLIVPLDIWHAGEQESSYGVMFRQQQHASQSHTCTFASPRRSA